MVWFELKDLRRCGKFSVLACPDSGVFLCGGLFVSAPASWSVVVLHRCGSGPKRQRAGAFYRPCRGLTDYNPRTHG